MLSALILPVLAIIHGTVRAVTVNGQTVGYRVSIGRVRLHVDHDEVFVWTVGSGASLRRLFGPAHVEAIETDPTEVVLPAAPHLLAMVAPAPVGPRPRVNVWRRSPRPAAVRLVGVAAVAA